MFLVFGLFASAAGSAWGETAADRNTCGVESFHIVDGEKWIRFGTNGKSWWSWWLQRSKLPGHYLTYIIGVKEGDSRIMLDEVHDGQEALMEIGDTIRSPIDEVLHLSEYHSGCELSVATIDGKVHLRIRFRMGSLSPGMQPFEETMFLRVSDAPTQ